MNTAINPEDTVAADINYHISCYSDLKNEARSANSKAAKSECAASDILPYDPLVFSQLITYIRYGLSPVKLTDLMKAYECKLEAVASDWRGKSINSTRFKNHILDKLGPGWSHHRAGIHVFIAHTSTVGNVLADLTHPVTEDEAQKIVDVGMMLRKYILEPQLPFNGSFNANCLVEPVPLPLLTLINVMLEGSQSVCEPGNLSVITFLFKSQYIRLHTHIQFKNKSYHQNFYSYRKLVFITIEIVYKVMALI